MIRPSSAFTSRSRGHHRSFGSDYFIRVSHSSIDLTEQVEAELEHNPGVADGGLISGEEKPKKRIPLPFLDPVSIPQWKTAPRRERDAFWQRMKDEVRYSYSHQALFRITISVVCQALDSNSPHSFTLYCFDLCVC